MTLKPECKWKSMDIHTSGNVRLLHQSHNFSKWMRTQPLECFRLAVFSDLV